MPAKASKGTWSLGVLKIDPQNSDQRDRLYVTPEFHRGESESTYDLCFEVT